MSYAVRIENFEGPLDLLLHLIKKNEMDIYDIPIAEITAQYLEYIENLKSLNLDVAGEFLVMAATLIHIKSRTLLPPTEEEEGDEEELDPREELVRRLLEYQKYKEAAGQMEDRPLLDRDVFACRTPLPEDDPEEEGEFETVGLFELVEAFRALLKERPADSFHDISVERLSVTDRINGILSLLVSGEGVQFGELFTEAPSRSDIVVTFLAMLELVRMRLVSLMQNARFGPIWLYPKVREGEESVAVIDEDALGYS